MTTTAGEDVLKVVAMPDTVCTFPMSSSQSFHIDASGHGHLVFTKPTEEPIDMESLRIVVRGGASVTCHQSQLSVKKLHIQLSGNATLNLVLGTVGAVYIKQQQLSVLNFTVELLLSMPHSSVATAARHVLNIGSLRVAKKKKKKNPPPQTEVKTPRINKKPRKE